MTDLIYVLVRDIAIQSGQWFPECNLRVKPVRVYFIIIVITMSAIGDLMMGDSLTQQWIDNLNMDVMFVTTLRSSANSPCIYF